MEIEERERGRTFRAVASAISLTGFRSPGSFRVCENAASDGLAIAAIHATPRRFGGCREVGARSSIG